MICCLFRSSTDARYIKLIVEIQSASPEAAGRDFPFSSLFAQLPGFSFGFGPTSACRSPEGVCSSLTQDGVKGAADLAALAPSGRGEGGVRRRRGEPAAAAAGVTLQQPEACRAIPGKVVPGSRDSGSGRLHRLPGGAVWTVTCACTQVSWWRQQQP